MSLVSVARSNRGRAGDPAWKACLPRSPMPHMPGSATNQPAHIGAIVFVASAIPHPTSMLDRLCFTWTSLRSMDRPSVDVRSNDSANRIHTHRIRYSLSHLSMSTKSNRFVASSMKKMRRNANAMH